MIRMSGRFNTPIEIRKGKGMKIFKIKTKMAVSI